MSDSLKALILASAAGVALLFVLALIFYVLYIIGNWKTVSKAGIPGWSSLIPIYNIYVIFKICWTKNMFWVYILSSLVYSIVDNMKNPPLWADGLVIACGLADIIIHIMLNLKLSKAFGHGTGFGLGLIFFPSIFIIILGLGSSRYLGNPSDPSAPSAPPVQG